MRTALSRLNLRAILTSALALAGSVLALAPGPGLAALPGGYSARLAAPLGAPKSVIVGEVLWKCADDHCAAPDTGTRPVIMCQRVARKIGEVAEFRSASGVLAPDDLAKCNAH